MTSSEDTTPETVIGVNEETGVSFCARCGETVKGGGKPHECRDPLGPVRGVLTGQVPVDSMPVAMRGEISLDDGSA